MRSGKGGKRKALLRRGRALAGLCLWGSRKELEKTTEKTKKKVKAKQKKIPSEICRVDALLGGPGKSRFKTWEANCRWVWRENFQISKKTKRDNKK